jgi:hypothetical protein
MIKRGDFFFCDNKCGFTETFDAVQEHEKTCKFRVLQAGEIDEMNEYTCDYGCGFTGTYSAVSEHELKCTHGATPEDSWEQNSAEFLMIGPPPPPPQKNGDANDTMNSSMPGYELGLDFPGVTGYWPMDGFEDPANFFDSWGLLPGAGSFMQVPQGFETHEAPQDYNWYPGKNGKIPMNDGFQNSKPKSKGKGKGKSK